MSNRSLIQYLLLPIGWGFGTVALLRRWLFHKGILKSFCPRVPTVCVGNIAIGGTGKTPHAAYIIRLLSEEWCVAMLSRGYGRTSKGYVLANTTPGELLSAELIGDEPLLLHQRFPELPLAVDGNRREGIRNLRKYNPAIDVVVLDDAYQHLSLKPSFRMVLTEYRRPYFNDDPMPAGRLREFPSAVKDADMVVVTKVDEPEERIDRKEWRKRLKLHPDQQLFFTRYRYCPPEPVTESAMRHTPDAEDRVVLITGIARPEPLVEYLKSTFQVYRHLSFPDHHQYAKYELDLINQHYFTKKEKNTIIFTTEKDWMRLQTEDIKKTVSLFPIYILPIEVEFLFDNEKDTFEKILKDHVRRKKEKN